MILPMIREGVCGESKLPVKAESWQVLVGEGAQERKSWPEKVPFPPPVELFGPWKGRRCSPVQLITNGGNGQTLTRSSLSIGKSHKVSQADSDRLLLINTRLLYGGRNHTQ